MTKLRATLKVAEIHAGWPNSDADDFLDECHRKIEIVATRIAFDRGSTKDGAHGEVAVVEQGDIAAAMAELRHTWRLERIDYEQTISSLDECNVVFARWYVDGTRPQMETLVGLRELREKLDGYIRAIETELLPDATDA